MQLVLVVGLTLTLLNSCPNFLCSSASRKGYMPTFATFCSTFNAVWLSAVQTSLVARASAATWRACHPLESTSASDAANGANRSAQNFSDSVVDCRVGACLLLVGSALSLSLLALPIFHLYQYCQTRRKRSYLHSIVSSTSI